MKKVKGVYKCPDCGAFEWCDCFREGELEYFGKWNELIKNVVEGQRIDEHRYRITVHCPQCGRHYTIHGEFD